MTDDYIEVEEIDFDESEFLRKDRIRAKSMKHRRMIREAIELRQMARELGLDENDPLFKP